MHGRTASTPLIREAVVIALSACGTPDSGSTILFMNRYTTAPQSKPQIMGPTAQNRELTACQAQEPRDLRY
jgi:hypothetical protein